jgi:Stress responsive A/B Barrel Domain
MKSSPEPSRPAVGWICLLLICPAFFLAACAIALPEAPTITHVVLIWMKHPGRAEDRRELESAALSLQRLPGVVRVETKRSLPPMKGQLRRDFDLAILITFRDRNALRLYEGDPRRLEAMRRYLRPLVGRYEVHNLSNR